MKNKKRLKLTWWETFTHYLIVPFMLIVPLVMAKDLFKIYVTETYTGNRSAEELINVTIPFLVLAVVFAIIQFRRLNFKEIEINYTEDQFQEAVERTVQDLGWKIENNQKNLFRAYRPWNWTGSWGEMITIISGKDKLFINSICDPNQKSSILSYGWNKRNISTFIKNLNETINGIPRRIKEN